MSNDYFYRVSGFIPPFMSDRLGGYGFSVELDPKFAMKALNFKLTASQRDKFLSEGKCIAGALGFGKGFVNENYSFVDDSLLLHVTSVPGDACGLGITGQNLEMFLRGIKDTQNLQKGLILPLEYYPHNVDSMKQAYGLLSLWLNWTELARVLVSPT